MDAIILAAEKIESNNLKEISSYSHLPNKVHQIIFGSLLGDMHCKKEYLNSNIEETHSIKQKNYVIWKYSILKNHFKLNEYHNLFYNSGKKIINQSVLNQLDTLGIAVWYCDDGYYDPENHTVEIHTEGFSIEENQILKEWFRNKCNLNVNFKIGHSKNKVILRFPIKEADKFLNLVKEHIFGMPLNKLIRTKNYQSKEEVKIRRNQQSKNFYYRNKEKILKEKAAHRKTKDYRDYIKKYYQRSDVKQRIKEYQEIYRQRPEVREKIKQYNKRARKKGDKN